MLKDFIKKEEIQIVQTISSWQDAVMLAGQPLLKRDVINTNYLEDVIRNIEKNGPYIILKEGFALPHAQSKDASVKQTSMSLLIVRDGISFSSSEEDTAKVIILLASENAQAHMEAMVELVDKLESDLWLEAMSQVQSTDEAVALLA